MATRTLRRAGERGEGRWQRISWDEAMTEIVDAMLDTIQEFLPSPLEGKNLEGRASAEEDAETVARRRAEDEPFCAYVFKTLADPFAGRITIFRVFSCTSSENSLSRINFWKDSRVDFSGSFFWAFT